MRGISLTIAVALLATSAHADDDVDYQKEHARLDREAKILFAAVAKQLAADKDYPVVPCSLAADWSTYGIDYATAHKALGLDVHGNLANPDDVAKPAEVFGNRVPKDAFCDDDARTKSVAKRVADWQAVFKALPKGAPPPPGIDLLVRSFSFPFFDRTFRRAVVVWIFDNRSIHFDDRGERRRGTIEGGGSALVYRRDRHGWRKVDDIDLFHAD